MMIYGSFECESCGVTTEWFYQIPNRMSSGRFDVDVYPPNKAGLRSKPYKIDRNRYTASCWCKNCGHLNSFEFDSEMEIH